MYSTLEGTEKLFADKYLKHLLSSFTGNTGLKKDFISAESILELDNKKQKHVISNNSVIQKIGENYKDKLGIYLFTGSENNNTKNRITESKMNLYMLTLKMLQ